MLNYFGQILNLGLNNPLNSLVTVLSENNEPKHFLFLNHGRTFPSLICI